MKRVRGFCVILLTLVVASSVAPVLAQGWGLKKTKIELKRKLAPFVIIKDKRIRIEAIAQGNAPKEVVEIIQTKLITDIQGDTGFIRDDKKPETILKFTVTAFDVEIKPNTVKCGDKEVVTTAVRGDIEVSYQAFDAKTAAPLDSENLKMNIAETYGECNTLFGVTLPSSSNKTPPSEKQVQNQLTYSTPQNLDS